MKMKSIKVDGIDTYENWGLVISEMTLSPPEPKYYLVDLPGGNGSLDITNALNPDTVYENRVQEFVFTSELVFWDSTAFEKLKTKVSNALHGRVFDYELSWDPGYTYHGRFTVDEYGTDGILRQITLKVEADPYKSSGMMTECYEMTTGATVAPVSGRKPVCPTFEFSADTIVTFNGDRYVMPKGTYKINDLFFTQGANPITFVLAETQSNLTWKEAKRYTWDVLASRPLYEWYKGIQKFTVPKITLEGTETPITGTVTFTIHDADGNTESSSVDLGDMFIGRIGEDCDRLTVIENTAYLYKVVKLNEDGTYGLLELPQSYTFPFAQLFFNDSEVVSLTCSAEGNLAYETEGLNIVRTVREVGWDHYMEGGALAKTWEGIGAYTWGQLRKAVFETVEGVEAPVVSDPEYAVYIQYEWLDL